LETSPLAAVFAPGNLEEIIERAVFLDDDHDVFDRRRQHGRRAALGLLRAGGDRRRRDRLRRAAGRQRDGGQGYLVTESAVAAACCIEHASSP